MQKVQCTSRADAITQATDHIIHLTTDESHAADDFRPIMTWDVNDEDDTKLSILVYACRGGSKRKETTNESKEFTFSNT